MTLSRALEHHRAGRLSEAEALYTHLLRDQPNDANLLGLLGILGLQKGSAAEAERLLSRALDQGGPDQIRIRNLNALAVLYFESGKHEAARTAIRAHTVQGTITPPEAPAEADAMTSLASCAYQLGESGVAQRLAETVEKGLAGGALDRFDVDAVGVLFARLGRDRSLKTLAEASEAHGRKLGREFWMKMGAIAPVSEKSDVRRLAEDRLCWDFPVLVDPEDQESGQRCRVLVLNWRPNFSSSDPSLVYNSTNTIGALALTRDQEPLAFDTLLVKRVDVDTIPSELPRPDIVFNNLANAEHNVLTGNTERASRIARSFGVPVLNDPAVIATTSREGNYRRLNDIAGVVVPKTTTFFMREEPASFFADSIGMEFGLPVIIRSVWEQGGEGLHLCSNRKELIETLEAFRGDYFYAIEYIDCPVEPGTWRKFRMACFGEKLLGHKLIFGNKWCVHSGLWQQLGPSRPDLQAEEERFLADPFGYLGTEAERAIREIKKRTPLDYFGIDFTIDAAGRLIVFEVNAAMRTLPYGSGRTPFPYLDETRARIRAAFVELLLSRAGHRQSGPG